MRRLRHEEMGDLSKATWPESVRSDESHALSTKANFSELWRPKSQGVQNLSAWGSQLRHPSLRQGTEVSSECLPCQSL